MVDVEESPLGTFEQDTFSCVGEILEDLRNVDCDRRDDFRCSQSVIKRLREIDRLGVILLLQQEIVIVEDLAEFCRKFFAHEQV